MRIQFIQYFGSFPLKTESGSAELADIFADCIYFINQADTEAPFALGLFVFGQAKNEAQCLWIILINDDNSNNNRNNNDNNDKLNV